MLSCELGAAAVRAFEPNPSVRRLLVRSASLQSSDIEIVPAACSDHEGTMPLYLSNPRNTGASSLKRSTESSVDVDLITLDGYARRTNTRPDLIKIDVEAHELEVLVGARSLLETARPTVIAEIAETKREDVIELMKRYRYAPHRILADGSTGVHGEKLAAGLPENICFVPSP
jgi:FkbM family methyltransferase